MKQNNRNQFLENGDSLEDLYELQRTLENDLYVAEEELKFREQEAGEDYIQEIDETVQKITPKLKKAKAKVKGIQEQINECNEAITVKSKEVKEKNSTPTSSILDEFTTTNKKKPKNSKSEVKAKAKELTNIETEQGLMHEDLSSDPLHILLKDIPIYRLYYVLWRVKTWGYYDSIPLHFIVWIQNMFRFKHKVTLNNQPMKATGLINLADSGSGKSHRAIHHKTLSKQIGVIVHDVDHPTPETLRGTVNIENNKYTIVKGLMSDAMIFIEELKSSFELAAKDSKYKNYLINLVEKTYIPGETLKAKQLHTEYFREQKLPFDKRKLKIEQETDFYIISEENFLFKNNTGNIIYGQPVLSNSHITEKEIQLRFGYEQGFYNRYIFKWDKHLLTPSSKRKFKDEQLEYIERYLTQFKTESVEKVYESYVLKFKDMFENYPQKDIPKSGRYEQFLEDCFIEQLDKTLIDEMNKEPRTTFGKYIYQYYVRVTENFLPTISYFISYLKGKEKLDKNEIILLCQFFNQSMLEFKEYAEEMMEEAIFTKYANQGVYTDYITTVIKNLYKNYILGNEDSTDIYNCYPSTNKLKQEVKNYFGAKHGVSAWKNKKYEESLSHLLEMETLKEFDTHPDTGKKFEKNSKKIVHWDRNKNKPREHKINKK